MNRNNIIVLGIALVAIILSTFVKCNRTNVTQEQVETQRAKVDSLQNVLDSLNSLPADTVTLTETIYKTKCAVNTVTDTILKEYPARSMSTQFTKDEVDLKFVITVQNSEVIDFDYEIINNRVVPEKQTYFDTAYMVQHQTIYDTIPVQMPIQSDLQLYQPRHFNFGFAVVADPTLSKLAPGLSLSYKQHELIGYYNVLDQAATDRLGIMYRFNFLPNYRLNKIGEDDKKDN
jgi:hypothetical protein